MNVETREQLRIALRNLAEAYAKTMTMMEQAYVLLSDELALDPFDFFRFQQAAQPASALSQHPTVDTSLLSITYRGRSCFLGNSLPFKLVDRLVRRPNVYFSYDELLSDVWQGIRSDAAVRSVVKILRQKLREAGLGELADSIDGSVPRHYALKLDKL